MVDVISLSGHSPLTISIILSRLLGLVALAVAETLPRLLDCGVGANLVELATPRYFDAGEQTYRLAVGQGKGGHSRPLFAGGRPVYGNSPIWHDSFVECARVGRHCHLGIHKEDAAGRKVGSGWMRRKVKIDDSVECFSPFI